MSLIYRKSDGKEEKITKEKAIDLMRKYYPEPEKNFDDFFLKSEPSKGVKVYDSRTIKLDKDEFIILRRG